MVTETQLTRREERKVKKMNKVILSGHLGATPELRHTPTGKSVTTLRLATNESFGGKKVTTWHRIVVWGKSAENCCKYLQTGRAISVEGRIDNRKYQDAEGKDRYISEVIASRVEFGAAPKGAQQTETPEVPDTEVVGLPEEPTKPEPRVGYGDPSL